MPSESNSHSKRLEWTPEAYAMAAQARVLSGNKLEELVVRLQRHSGRTKDQCWRFIIQRGLKRATEHRRWTDDEMEYVREELVSKSLDEVAAKLQRSPQAIRSMLRRSHLSMRDIRCDRFSLESLSTALRIRKTEIHFWIDQGWLRASVETHGRKRFYVITPEALKLLYKKYLPQLLARGTPNLALFEAYLQYCYSPKHTVGEQLLDVRRDKKERASYEARQDGKDEDDDDEEEEDHEDDERHPFDRHTDDNHSDDIDDTDDTD